MLEGVISNELMGGKVIRSCASVIVARKGRGREGGERIVSNSRGRGKGSKPYQLMII